MWGRFRSLIRVWVEFELGLSWVWVEFWPVLSWKSGDLLSFELEIWKSDQVFTEIWLGSEKFPSNHLLLGFSLYLPSNTSKSMKKEVFCLDLWSEWRSLKVLPHLELCSWSEPLWCLNWSVVICRFDEEMLCKCFSKCCKPLFDEYRLILCQQQR